MAKSKLTGKYHGQVFNSRCGHSNTLTFVVNKIMNFFIQSLNKCWIKIFLIQNFLNTFRHEELPRPNDVAAIRKLCLVLRTIYLGSQDQVSIS